MQSCDVSQIQIKKRIFIRLIYYYKEFYSPNEVPVNTFEPKVPP